MPEEEERHRSHPSEPLYPIPLLPELAEFLARQGPFACVTQATDQGVAYVLKAPGQEIVRARGTVPVQVQHALYDHRLAPVIRTVLSLYDVPQHPLRFETFCNVADPTQRADFAALGEQDQFILLFYDERATRSVETGDNWGMTGLRKEDNSPTDAGCKSPPCGVSGNAPPPG